MVHVWYSVPSCEELPEHAEQRRLQYFPTRRSDTSMMSSSLRIGGAGAVVQLDADGSDASKPVYLVSPASHIGRVVTGVVLMGEGNSAKAPGTDSTASAAERFGLASVAFADKLAEQGYKVVVVDAAWTKAKEEDLQADAARAEEAAAFLKRHHDVQRVAFLGYGAGADVAISIALVEPVAQPAFDCFVALSPEGRGAFTSNEATTALAPTLLLVGAKTTFARSDAFQQLQDTFAKHPVPPTSPPTFRSRVFANQSKGFAFSGITDEDAATQAIAEVLDWLVLHLHRFRVAACTSDTDPWWPQGRNGPFCNVGQKTWQEERNAWLTATVARPPRPPPVPSHLLFDGLSSMRRTFDLPHRMALGDVVELFVEIWEVQQ